MCPSSVLHPSHPQAQPSSLSFKQPRPSNFPSRRAWLALACSSLNLVRFNRGTNQTGKQWYQSQRFLLGPGESMTHGFQTMSQWLPWEFIDKGSVPQTQIWPSWAISSRYKQMYCILLSLNKPLVRNHKGHYYNIPWTTGWHKKQIYNSVCRVLAWHE